MYASKSANDSAVSGLFPCFVYIDLSKHCQDIEDILFSSKEGLMGTAKKGILKNLHVSLSNGFFLPHHQVRIFQKELQEIIDGLFPSSSQKKLTFGLNLACLELFDSSYSSRASMSPCQEQSSGSIDEVLKSETNLRKRAFCDETRAGDDDSSQKDSESETTKSAVSDGKRIGNIFLCATINTGLAPLKVLLREVNRLIIKHLPDYRPQIDIEKHKFHVSLLKMKGTPSECEMVRENMVKQIKQNPKVSKKLFRVFETKSVSMVVAGKQKDFSFGDTPL